MDLLWPLSFGLLPGPGFLTESQFGEADFSTAADFWWLRSFQSPHACGGRKLSQKPDPGSAQWMSDRLSKHPPSVPGAHPWAATSLILCQWHGAVWHPEVSSHCPCWSKVESDAGAPSDYSSLYGPTFMLVSTPPDLFWNQIECSFWVRLHSWASLVAQIVKNLPAMQGVWALGGEDPLEKGMATPSSILAQRILWTEEPGRLQSMGWQRVGHDWATHTSHFLSHSAQCIWDISILFPVSKILFFFLYYCQISIPLIGCPIERF